ncbi:MAG: hypothetical protein JSS97_01000 [Actinobacteria bacterium]|nr:hypothetical protein [Actinomycetota bacterium]
MADAGRRVGICFGGPSVEHDVSIISGIQLTEALRVRHSPVPIYAARDGRFWTGESLTSVSTYGSGDPTKEASECDLRLGGGGDAGFFLKSSSRFRSDEPLPLDAIICAIHGTGGEDGAILGAFELTGIPYAGGGVLAAAVSMNKQTAKAVFQAVGIPTNPGIVIGRTEFAEASSATIERVTDEVGEISFVKPMSLGSSIGVSRCSSVAELRDGLELAFELDRSALVEPAVEGAIEVNCAVAGRADGELQASACEQPLIPDGSELLGFDEKYVAGGKGKAGGGKDSGMAGQERIIPAPISDSLTTEVQELAKRAHRALGFSGIARYDFFIKDPEGDAEVLLNEANTVPGSFSFYLFEPVGIDFADLGELLLDIAFAEATERRLTTNVFESVLLQDRTSSASS